jgi:hypothetical protein
LRLVGCVRLLQDIEFSWGKLLGCSIDFNHCVGYLIGSCEFHSYRAYTPGTARKDEDGLL